MLLTAGIQSSELAGDKIVKLKKNFGKIKTC